MDILCLRRVAHVSAALLWLLFFINHQVTNAGPPSLETLADQGDAVVEKASDYEAAMGRPMVE